MKDFVKAALACVAMILWLGTSALAHDHHLLEENVPTELDDAYPVPYRGMEFHLPARWEKQDKGKDQAQLLPRFLYGVLPDTEVSLQVPIYMGEADQKESGDIAAEVFYNFNVEGLYLPAVALAGAVQAPTGYESDTTETRVKLNLTKAIFPTSLFHYLHANLLWGHLYNESEEERDDRLKVVGGYSQRLTPETLAVVDYVFEQKREKDSEHHLVEGGIRYQLTPRLILGGGGAAGLGAESPDFRLLSALQVVF